MEESPTHRLFPLSVWKKGFESRSSSACTQHGWERTNGHV